MHLCPISPREHFDDAVSACADDVSSVLTPNNAADTLAAHGSVRIDVLGADTLVQGPEADRGVMTGGNGLAPILGQRQ